MTPRDGEREAHSAIGPPSGPTPAVASEVTARRLSFLGQLGRPVSGRIAVRRSTVVMAVAFLALGGWYLAIKPSTPAGSAGTGTSPGPTVAPVAPVATTVPPGTTVPHVPAPSTAPSTTTTRPPSATTTTVPRTTTTVRSTTTTTTSTTTTSTTAPAATTPTTTSTPAG